MVYESIICITKDYYEFKNMYLKGRLEGLKLLTAAGRIMLGSG